MTTEEFMPRSAAFREALEKSGHGKRAATAMLTVAEACEHLRISKWTLYRQMNEGKLAYMKIGSRRLIPVKAITEYIERNQVEPKD